MAYESGELCLRAPQPADSQHEKEEFHVHFAGPEESQSSEVTGPLALSLSLAYQVHIYIRSINTALCIVISYGQGRVDS